MNVFTANQRVRFAKRYPHKPMYREGEIVRIVRVSEHGDQYEVLSPDMARAIVPAEYLKEL